MNNAFSFGTVRGGQVNEAYRGARRLEEKVATELKSDIDIIYCSQAIIAANGKWISDHSNTFKVDLIRRRNAGENWSRILGKPVAVCLRALALSEDDIGSAMEMLVSCGDLVESGNMNLSHGVSRSTEHDNKLDDLRSMLSELQKMKKLYNERLRDGDYVGESDGIIESNSELRISALIECENPSYRLLNSSSPRQSHGTCMDTIV
jgi:hypothetical protein